MPTPQSANTVIISSEAELRLRKMLQHLRWEKKIKYKSIEYDIGEKAGTISTFLNKRRPATEGFYRKIEKYYRDNNYVFEADLQPDAEFGLDYILDALDMGPEKISRSVNISNGRYLLFTLLPNSNVTVTWFELFSTSKNLTVPVFKARRFTRDGEIIYKGFYYIDNSSLFMFGHIVNTSLARSIILVPAGSAHPRDRFGIVTGASPVESIFSAVCYLKKLANNASRLQYKSILKEHYPVDLREEYGEILENLNTRKEGCFSHLRDTY